MQFGLINILAIFQKRINSVLEEYLDEFIIAYLNNIIIYSNSKEEHFYISKLLGCQDPGGLLESSWRPPGGPGRILIFLIVLIVLTGS